MEFMTLFHHTQQIKAEGGRGFQLDFLSLSTPKCCCDNTTHGVLTFNLRLPQEKYILLCFLRGAEIDIDISALLCVVQGAFWDALHRGRQRAARLENFTTIDFIPLDNHNSICSLEANKGLWPSGGVALKAQPKWCRQVSVSLRT